MSCEGSYDYQRGKKEVRSMWEAEAEYSGHQESSLDLWCTFCVHHTQNSG